MFRSPTILQPAVLWSGHHRSGRRVAHLHCQHQHVSYTVCCSLCLHACAWPCYYLIGEIPLYVMTGQPSFPVCRPLETAPSHYHIVMVEVLILSPSAHSTIGHNILWGQLYKVFGLSCWDCVLTDGRLPLCCIVYREAAQPQGWLDCILISGHSYMVAQSNRGHEAHQHHTLSTHTQTHKLSHTRAVNKLCYDHWNRMGNITWILLYNIRILNTDTCTQSYTHRQAHFGSAWFLYLCQFIFAGGIDLFMRVDMNSSKIRHSPIHFGILRNIFCFLFTAIFIVLRLTLRANQRRKCTALLCRAETNDYCPHHLIF